MQVPEHLRQPIGPWAPRESYTPESIQALAERIADLPHQYSETVMPLSEADLNRTYRPGAWTVRQLVHHLADMHMLHLVRLKHALTEPGTTVGVGANIDAWAGLVEAQTAPVQPSLLLMQGLHQRIANLALHLDEDELRILYYHPVRQRNISLAEALDLIRWHAEHHLAHIRLALS